MCIRDRSIGDNFAVVCTESIDSENRESVLESLKQTHEVIEVSLEQAEQGFCANILQVSNQKGDKFIAMSDSAYKKFTEQQLSILSKHGKIIHASLPTIEEIGGGSARCMLCEVFLQRNSA
eukprot:TRINITY_DN2699_c0_g1_i4.p2 TRINITY_DN2699_c0_g1~~TRINITY_DN2699_c0_g1_i4.p2  ORF type:complete len:121 (+),score=26.88 TRINITY_DN2699_c0_g1_i4:63-425(+)